jgi:predicted transcriptional regulator
MKTAISIPDDVFEQGERLATRLGTSRSALYSRALREFIARHAGDVVTESLDAVYADEPAPDAFVVRAARAALSEDDW